jgi:membrane fusion protein (multidrug efflux system)
MKKLAWIVIGTIVFISSCSKSATKPVENTTKIPVKVSAAIEKEYAEVKSYSGLIKASRESNLGSTLPGKIEKVYCHEGQMVKKGDLLAEVSGEMLVQAEIEYNTLKKDNERMEHLLQKGSITQMEYDHVHAKFEASEARMDLMRKNTQVVAPYDGIVSEIMIGEGENYSLLPQLDQSNLSISTGIIKLVKINPLILEFEASENELEHLSTGMSVQFTCDAIRNEKLKGKILFISPSVTGNAHSVKIKAELNQASKGLRPGMYAQVSIQLEKTKAIFIPAKSILRLEGTGEEYVFVVERNTAHRTSIKRLDNVGEEAAVTGVKAGDQLVVEGKSKLSDGTVILVQK